MTTEGIRNHSSRCQHAPPGTRNGRSDTHGKRCRPIWQPLRVGDLLGLSDSPAFARSDRLDEPRQMRQTRRSCLLSTTRRLGSERSGWYVSTLRITRWSTRAPLLVRATFPLPRDSRLRSPDPEGSHFAAGAVFPLTQKHTPRERARLHSSGPGMPVTTHNTGGCIPLAPIRWRLGVPGLDAFCFGASALAPTPRDSLRQVLFAGHLSNLVRVFE